MAKKENVV